MELTTKPVETNDELRLANELIAGIQVPGSPVLRRWLLDFGAQYPGYRREHTRIALYRGELAGALRLNTETIRIGEARLKMGGLGWVTTAERHRKKGICTALIDDALTYMREHGYHVSMLFGIPDFYHRFGYVTTLAHHEIVVDTPEASTFRNPFKVRMAKPGDIPAMQKLHAAHDEGAACSLIRTAAHLSNKWENWNKWRVLTDKNGKVIAYFHANPEEQCLRVAEVGLNDPGVSPGILAAAAQLADETPVSSIRFCAPPYHPFARFMLQFRSRHEMLIRRDEGGMMRFINVAESLENMIPEWESLLSQHAARDYRTEFTLCVDGKAFRVRANRGAIDVAAAHGKNKVSLTPAGLVHLITGYCHLADILNSRWNLVVSEARQLMAALFPKRSPFVWPFDRF